MSRTYKDSKAAKRSRRERSISVRGVRKDPPDLRKLSRALIQLAMAEAEAEAEAQATDRDHTAGGPTQPGPTSAKPEHSDD